MSFDKTNWDAGCKEEVCSKNRQTWKDDKCGRRSHATVYSDLDPELVEGHLSAVFRDLSIAYNGKQLITSADSLKRFHLFDEKNILFWTETYPDNHDVAQAGHANSGEASYLYLWNLLKNIKTAYPDSLLDSKVLVSASLGNWNFVLNIRLLISNGVDFLYDIGLGGIAGKAGKCENPISFKQSQIDTKILFPAQ